MNENQSIAPELKVSIKETEKAIKGAGKYTLQDLGAKTGLPLEEVRRSMDKLVMRYRAGISVSSEGTLVYDFGSALVRRGAKTREEQWEEWKEIFWKGFKAFYKVWISIMLVVYFVVFVVMLIALIVASTASGDKDKKGNNGGEALSGLFGMIVDLMRSIFWYRTITNTWHYENDRRGYKYRHYDPVTDPFSMKTKEKGFIASVYDFVFGPERYELHPLANHKEAAAFIRKEKGIVTLPELKALAGWEQTKAEEFFSDILIRFKGTAKMTEEGVLYGDFEEMLDSEQDNDGKIEWYWDEYEAKYEWTGNKMGKNALILFMNLFNLTASGFVLYTSYELMGTLDELPFWFTFLLGIFPFVFSVIFFAVPILRYAGIQSNEKEREKRNIKKRLLKEIWMDEDKRVGIKQLLDSVNKDKSLEKLNKKTVEQVMKEVVSDFNAEIEGDEKGEVVYVFSQMLRDLETADAIRKNVKPRDKGFLVMEVGD